MCRYDEVNYRNATPTNAYSNRFVQLSPICTVTTQMTPEVLLEVPMCPKHYRDDTVTNRYIWNRSKRFVPGDAYNIGMPYKSSLMTNEITGKTHGYCDDLKYK